MSRVYNFAAGPAVLPEEVLKEAAEEMLDYRGTGMSVMEMSHRSKAFEEIIQDAERDLRELMNIPDNYKVLFLQGGGSTQFAMIPMNLMKNRVADYIITGQWAKKAAEEVKNKAKSELDDLVKTLNSKVKGMSGGAKAAVIGGLAVVGGLIGANMAKSKNKNAEAAARQIIA